MPRGGESTQLLERFDWSILKLSMNMIGQISQKKDSERSDWSVLGEVGLALVSLVAAGNCSTFSKSKDLLAGTVSLNSFCATITLRQNESPNVQRK